MLTETDLLTAIEREPADGLAWLAMEPVTGRTHQLRVHAAAQGWPIVGDNIYGNGPPHLASYFRALRDVGIRDPR